MAEHGDTRGECRHRHHKVSGTAVLLAIAVSGPLLVMAGFTFLATFMLLFISSPLHIISSPLLIFGALVLVAALSGFASACAMALAGLSLVGWVFRSGEWAVMLCGIGYTGVTELIESGEKVKEEEK